MPPSIALDHQDSPFHWRKANTTDAAVTAVSTAAGSATDSVVPARSCAGIMSPMTSKEITTLLPCWDTMAWMVA